MSKPFELRYARLIAGGLILGCLSLVGVGLSKGHLLFPAKKAVRVYYVWPENFAPTSTDANRARSPALRRAFVQGSRVELLGQKIGMVEEVTLHKAPDKHATLDASGSKEKKWLMRCLKLIGQKTGVVGEDSFETLCAEKEICLIGHLKLHGDLADLVRADSEVYVRHEMAGFGGIYLEVTPGSGAAPEQALKVKDAGSALSDMEAFGEMLKYRLTALVDKLEGLQEKASALLDTEGQVPAALATVTKTLDETNKTLSATSKFIAEAGQVIKIDEENSLNAVARNVRELTNNLNKVDFVRIQAQLVATSRSLESSSKAMEEMGRSIKKTSDAAQKTFLFRSAVAKVEAEEKQREDIQTKPGAVPARPVSPPAKPGGIR